MNFKFANSGDMLTLPKAPLIDKLGSASENEIKILLYAAAASADGSFDENAVQKISGLDLTEIIIALQFWRGAGILTLGSEKTPSASTDIAPEDNNTENERIKIYQKHDIPQYTGEEIERLFNEKPEITLLIEECHKIAEKMLNHHEINKIVAFYDYLGLSCEYILSLYAYCKRTHPNMTIHYLEKTLFGIYNEGIDTDEKLREHLKKREEYDSMAGHVRRLFGLNNRALSKKEAAQIAKWNDIYKVSDELLEYAFDQTVTKAAKPTLAYMGRILDNWFSAGITTVEQAKEASINFQKSKEESQKSAESSFDNDEFFNAALKKSYENIGKNSNN